MNLKQIHEKVAVEADARFGETIDRLLTIVRNRHTHNCNKECGCEYCRFITGDYIQNKLRLHRLKKDLRYYDNGDFHLMRLDHDMMRATNSHNFYWILNFTIEDLKRRIKELKCHKKDLRTNII